LIFNLIKKELSLQQSLFRILWDFEYKSDEKDAISVTIELLKKIYSIISETKEPEKKKLNI
jgi:hypothetical protein